VDLVDEEDVARTEVRQDRREVARLLEDGARRDADWAPISRAMMWASVVLPRPGGPKRRTWSSGSFRLRAAVRKTPSVSRSFG
jgi:hypothetical protein